MRSHRAVTLCIAALPVAAALALACGGSTAPDDAGADVSNPIDASTGDGRVNDAFVKDGPAAPDTMSADSATASSGRDSASVDSASQDVSSTMFTCTSLFTGSGCLSGCLTAQQACAAAGEGAAFQSFLDCIATAGYQCTGSQVAVTANSCTAEIAPIASCSGGPTDAGPG
jgi:hypothetical protein